MMRPPKANLEQDRALKFYCETAMYKGPMTHDPERSHCFEVIRLDFKAGNPYLKKRFLGITPQ
jgi:hypothetical protein